VRGYRRSQEKNQIQKYTNKVIRERKKHYQRKKIPWVTEKHGKAIEAYIIKISDSTNYSYYIASMKTETNSKEKIIIGNTYVMELNMIRYMGEVRGFSVRSIGINNGTCIPPDFDGLLN